MEEKSEYGQQLSEIHEIINESRFKMTGGGAIALVWGILTAIAIAVPFLIPELGRDMTYIWAAHNVLGWTFTLAIFQRISRQEGRVSVRGLHILYIWALWTLAIWMSSFVLESGQVQTGATYAGVMTLLIGMGIFATGLVGNSRFSQVMGAIATVIGPGLAILAPRALAWQLSFGSMIVIIMAWGIASWVVKER